MMDLLKVGKLEGRKGSVFRVQWTPDADLALLATKEALGLELSLQTVNPDRPFVLRTDAPGNAIGAVLEQVQAGVECGALLKDEIQAGTTAPVAFSLAGPSHAQHKLELGGCPALRPTPVP